MQKHVTVNIYMMQFYRQHSRAFMNEHEKLIKNFYTNNNNRKIWIHHIDAKLSQQHKDL